jgi:hypothetical protein
VDPGFFSSRVLSAEINGRYSLNVVQPAAAIPEVLGAALPDFLNSGKRPATPFVMPVRFIATNMPEMVNGDGRCKGLFI